VTTELLGAALAGILGSIIGAGISVLVSKRYLTKKAYTPSNAVELLKLGRPEEWNEVRIQHPDWIPRLSGCIFDGMKIPAINLRQADISEASFKGAMLDSADFLEADAHGTDFSSASLVGARFDYADLGGANLKGANLEGASFQQSKLSDEDQVAIPHSEQADQIESLRGKELLSAVATTPNLIYRITPSQFENLLTTMFRSLNYEVELPGSSHDRGYDLLVTRKDPLGGEEKLVVEAKRTRSDLRVGESSLRALYAGLLATGADQGILVTTSQATVQAHRFAEQIGNLRIIDREKLFDWLKKAASFVG
jgi:uncharacterized protein YjbI with pentapeptide repeats